MKAVSLSLGIVFLTLFFTGCSDKLYTQSSVGQIENLHRAEVIAVRDVEIKDDGSGMVIGGVGGGALGSLFGGTTQDKQIATVVGAIAGAALGSQVNKNAGQELLLRLANGSEIVTLHKISKNTPYSFREGDRVKVYMTGGKISRIYLDR